MNTMLLDTIGQDLRYGARLLRLNPGFAAVAIFSLALGIGANTAIFQLLDAVRLRSLPVKNPQQLARIRVVYEPKGRSGRFEGYTSDLTNTLWEHIRDQQQGFSQVGAWTLHAFNTSPRGQVHMVPGLWVSGSFFDMLGVRPALGRLIFPSDDVRGCGSPGAVISYSFWQREFGGARSVLGNTITLQGHPFPIIGVTPANFFGVEVGRNFDVALPICAEPVVNGERSLLNTPEGWWLAAIGRLKPGWSVARASAQLAAISPAVLQATLPPGYDSINREQYLQLRLGASPAASGISQLREDYGTPLWLLIAITGLVLLIACANLANLMMARASARQGEMAVRLALGASRARLIRQVLAESLLLAVIGAVCGAALAGLLSRTLVSYLSTQDNQVFLHIAFDWRVLGFTAALAIFTCLLFGLTPALQAAGTAPGDAMKASSRSLTTGGRRFSLRRALVVSQMALSLVLLVGALLFVRTFRNLATLDTGFHRDHILVANLDFSNLNLPPGRRAAFKQALADHIAAMSGVTAAATEY